jgi:predicted cupin superfamily sugar epimerase
MTMNADEIRGLLGMLPLPREGGYFVETHRSLQQLPLSALPSGYQGRRAAGTAIYYLLTPETCSAMHRLPGDEIFHFYLGDPVEMLQLHPDGRGETVVIGPNLAEGMRPQVIVPAGVWQGSHLIPGGCYALLGTTMAIGFDFQDYEGGSRDQLVEEYPQFSDLIERLTP